MRKIYLIMVIIAALCISTAVMAQDAPPVPQTVQTQAADGLTLIGDFYSASATDGQPRPAVLLMHMLNSNRAAWKPLIQPLLDAHYAVLAVDLRGHGDTGGRRDWDKAATDVQTWLDWLRGQAEIRKDAISIIGASVGSNLALIGCANDAECVTAIALSPGLDYLGVKPEQSVIDGLADRSALLIASQNDPAQSAPGVKQMVKSAPGEIGARIFTGNLHGTDLFGSATIGPRLTMLIIDWLDEHTPPAQD